MTKTLNDKVKIVPSDPSQSRRHCQRPPGLLLVWRPLCLFATCTSSCMSYLVGWCIWETDSGSSGGANDPMTSWWWFEVTTGSALGQQMVSWAPFHPEPPCLQNCVAHLKLYRSNNLILVIDIEFFNNILPRPQTIQDQDGVIVGTRNAFSWELVTCYKTWTWSLSTGWGQEAGS